MCAALSFVFLLLGNITSLFDMCGVVLCGLVTIILFCEVGIKYTISSCVVCLLLGFFIISDKALVFLYFGAGALYPIAKIYTRRKKKIISLLTRIAIGISTIVVYIVLLRWLMPDEISGKLIIIGALVGVISFVLYDILISKFLMIYIYRLNDVFKRITKRK